MLTITYTYICCLCRGVSLKNDAGIRSGVLLYRPDCVVVWRHVKDLGTWTRKAVRCLS